MEFGQWAFDQFFVVLKFLSLLKCYIDDLLFVVHNLLPFQELSSHFEHFGMQTQVWESIAVVLFKTFLKLFLESFIFVFCYFHFSFQLLQVFLKIRIIASNLLHFFIQFSI